MPTVEHRIVPAESVPTVHVAVSINEPDITRAFFVFQHDIRAVGHTGLDDEVLAQHLGNVAILRVVFEEFIAVGVGQLAEVLEVPFDIEVQALRQIKLEA